MSNINQLYFRFALGLCGGPLRLCDALCKAVYLQAWMPCSGSRLANRSASSPRRPSGVVLLLDHPPRTALLLIGRRVSDRVVTPVHRVSP